MKNVLAYHLCSTLNKKFKGGFVRPNEPVEQAANRELEEETGLSEVGLHLLQIFSKPDRDPRGWIMSAVFMGEVNEGAAKLVYGEDSIGASWMQVSKLPEIELAFDHRAMIDKALALK